MAAAIAWKHCVSIPFIAPKIAFDSH